MNQNELLETIIKERPIASMANERVLDMMQTEAIQMGWNVISKSFVCTKWEKGRSSIEIGKHSYEIFPSPFSKAYKGNGDIIVIHSLEELENFNITEKIVFLKDNIAKESMQPKNFPFYYPDGHKHIIDLLEEKKPKAIIAVTGKHEMCGLNPFPMFEDGNFSIPSAYINELTANNILNENGKVNLNIVSNNSSGKSRQIIIARKGRDRAAGKIIICAHMDTKYGTPGAIDNAAGLLVLLKIMENLKDYTNSYDIDIVPFNGEEYYEVKGQLEYLDYIKDDFDAIKLVINIDSPCHKDSNIAVSTYNMVEKLSAKLNAEMKKDRNVVMGEQWYAGDHSIFAFKGIPCIAVTSSDLFETVIQFMHTQRDTIDQISYDMINQTADFLTELIKSVANN